MGILITQSTDLQEYTVIKEDNIRCKITKLELDPKTPGVLRVTLTVAEGANKGQNVFMRAPFLKENKGHFLYLALRKAAGCPYTKGEGAKIDIESLLLNKIIRCKLSGRDYNGSEYQNVMPIAAKGTRTPSSGSTHETSTGASGKAGEKTIPEQRELNEDELLEL